MVTVPSVGELELLMSKGWQGTTQVALGGWLIRAGGGFTGRANSVLPLGSVPGALDDAVREVTEFYDARGLPAKFQMPSDVPNSELWQLAGELRDRGWQPFDTTLVMIAPLDSVLDGCPPSPAWAPARLEREPSTSWLGGYLYRGSTLPPEAVAVLVKADRPVFASVFRADVLVGVGRGVVTDDWLGVTAVTVVEGFRRSGVGRHIMGEMARWAADLGAGQVYLQVDGRNAAAITMYENLGFTEHHRYCYLAAPTGS